MGINGVPLIADMEKLLIGTDVSINEKVLPIRLNLDVYYVKHASLWWDIKLIMWTVIAILYTALGKYPQWMHNKLVGYSKTV